MQPYCIVGFTWEKVFFLMENTFTAPATQHGCHTKPLHGHFRKPCIYKNIKEYNAMPKGLEFTGV